MGEWIQTHFQETFSWKDPNSKIESVCEVFAISERNDLKIAFDRIQLQVWMQVMYVG